MTVVIQARVLVNSPAQKAIKLKSRKYGGEFWVPKSVVTNLYDIEVDGDDWDIEIHDWFYRNVIKPRHVG